MSNSLRKLSNFLVKRTGHRHYSQEEIWERYNQVKQWLKSKKLPRDVDEHGVFANGEIALRNIDVYGFDYDYTLASYKTSVEHLIHDTAKEKLVRDYKYPSELREVEYNPRAFIRGLHYDIEKGVILKVDAFHQIQMGTVFRGREKLSDEHVLNLYQKQHIPLSYIEAHLKFGPAKPNMTKMIHLVDIFAKPKISLISEVIHWFHQNNIDYEPYSLYKDIEECIQEGHIRFHAEVQTHPENYLRKDPELQPYLERLLKHGKKLFLITNSNYETVESGMKYMLNSDWRELFDFVIVAARKPNFFTDKSRTFREYNLDAGIYLWGKTKGLSSHKVYAGGSLFELQRTTSWRGEKVLYFGDHPYADLADLTLHHGWRTGAIIREVEEEIKIMNSDEYKWNLNWNNVLTQLLEDNQDFFESDNEAKDVVIAWRNELLDIRNALKVACHPRFGSMFRTHQASTYFSRRLFRFADLYTSKLTNLNKYSVNHTFYPRRGALPHEFRSWFV